jgi:hypothetical protein
LEGRKIMFERMIMALENEEAYAGGDAEDINADD